MTATFRLSCTVPLQQFAAKNLFTKMTRRGSQTPRYFQSARMRVYTRDKRITALIYASGKVVLVGANRETQLMEAMEQICSVMKACVMTPLSVSNYVFTIDIPPVNLDQLFLFFRQLNDKRLHAYDYTPELFPALICHFCTRYKATIFRSGKINIIGCCRREEGRKASETLCEMLHLFRSDQK